MYKQAPKSPAMKALVGNQKNLPAGLKAQIEAAPGKMMDSPTKNMNKGYGSPAKQVSVTELKTTTKNTGGLSKMALANAGRDMLKADYGIENPNMSDKAIADSIKKYGRTGEVRSRVKQGLKKGDNEGDFKGSFGSPAQMKSPAKQTNDQKAKSMEASKEKKVSVASGASKGKASTNRDYVKGGRKKENGSREKSKTTKFSTTDGGKTYTKTTTKGKQGKVKVKTKEISGTKAKKQADRLNKKYTRV